MKKETYLVDIADIDPKIGVWETWHIMAHSAQEAQRIAEHCLENRIKSGAAVGEFRVENVRSR